MSRTDSASPPLPAVQAALRDATETLARELGHPSERAPEWSAFEWRVARAVAGLHGVSGLLSARLRWSEPADWSAFLEVQRTHTLRRYARIEALLQAIDTAARDARVAFVVLKGAALHRLGLYAAGERAMADLDLLVSAAHLERMAGILEALRYRQTAVTWKHRVFEQQQVPEPAAFGEHADNGIKIDLHVRIREILPRNPVEIAAVILPAEPHPGLNAYRSHAALMAHLLLHAAGAIAQRTLRLVQLHDLALLSARMSAHDWAELTGPIAQEYGLWWALAPMMLVERYYEPFPAEVMAHSAAHCHWPLRRSSRKKPLWEVSFSNLRRSAFPGIEWSRSALEVLMYAAQRTGLTTQVLRRSLLSGTVRGGVVDGVAGRGGHILPEGGWIALRPARPATLLAVRQALTQP